jgi:hypothetical protein
MAVATIVGLSFAHVKDSFNPWYGIVAFLITIILEILVISLWPKIAQRLSSKDEEADYACIMHKRLLNRLEFETKRISAGAHAIRDIHVDQCKQALIDATTNIESKKLEIAWDRLRFVEEMLLLLYEKDELIAQIEPIASRAQELPEGKGQSAIKSLDQAQLLLKQNANLPAPDEAKFRTYLKEALTAINGQRRLFHWHRSIYKTQAFYLLAVVSPLLLGFFILFWSFWLSPPRPLSIFVSLQFLLQIFILGAIGGMVSMLQSERSLGEGVTSFYYGRVGLWIKPAIGAVGAVIIFFLFLSGLLFNVVDVAQTNNSTAVTPQLSATGQTPSNGIIKIEVISFYFYYVLAFFSGFSERFFTATVARLEGRLNG